MSINYISSDDVDYEKPKIDEYLEDYNVLLANILKKNIGSLKYLTSSTINRLEQQTHLYENIEKAIQIIKILNSETNDNLCISKNDKKLYWPLKRKYGRRIKGCKYDIRSLRFVFIFRIIYLFTINFIYMFVGKINFRPQKKYKYIIRSYFNIGNMRYSENFKDVYFGELIDDIKKDASLLLIFKILHWRDIKKYLNVRKKMDHDTCIREYFLSPYTLIKAFITFFHSRIRIKGDLYFKGIDISELVQDSFDEDYYLLRGLTAYLEYFIAQKIIELNPERLLYPFENQTWEKMYPYMKNKKNSKTIIVGFQHSGFSLKVLNYFPSRVEKDLPIFPDKILTVGNIFKDIMKEKAHYPSELMVGGALRHGRYFNGSEIKMTDPVEEVYGRIAYAFSYERKKYNPIIEILTDIFGDTEIEVFLKYHPMYNRRTISKIVRCELPDNFIPAGDMDWEDIFPLVDCILYDDNSIGVEGLIKGVKTFMLDEEEPIYNNERLFKFTEWYPNIDKKGLMELKDKLINRQFDKSYNVENVRSYLLQYYTPYYARESLDKFLS